MKKKFWGFITQIIGKIFRVCLSLRYKVNVTGLENIPENPKKYIIIPNHSALIDPVILVSHFWPKIQLRWIAWKPSIPFFLRFWVDPLLNPLYISEKTTKEGKNVVLQEMINSLNDGNNQLIAPSGMLSRDGGEVLGKVRGISTLLQEVEGLKVILVRIRGLYGSRFSWGYNKKNPNLWLVLLSGFFLLLGNLIFFTPRRKVNIEVVVTDKSIFPGLELEKVNQFLEDWYNFPEIEPITKTKLFFFSRN